MTLQLVKPVYFRSFKNSSIIANGTYQIPIEQEAIDEHKFFNDLLIINTSSSDIEIIRDDNLNAVTICPAKGNLNFSFVDDNIRFTKLSIKELSSNPIDENKIFFNIIKKKYISIENQGGNE
jgi:hypothetical protein